MKLTIDEFQGSDVVMLAPPVEDTDDGDYQDHDMSPIADLEYDC